MFDKQKVKGYYTNMNKLESYQKQMEEVKKKLIRYQSLVKQREDLEDHNFNFKQKGNLYIKRSSNPSIKLPPGLPFIEDWILAYIQEKLDDVNLQIKEYEEEV